MLLKTLNNPDHLLYTKLPGPYHQRRTNGYALSLNDRAFSAIHFGSGQFSRCFLPFTCRIMSELADDVTGSPNVQSFKTAVNALFCDFLLKLFYIITFIKTLELM